MTLRGPVRGNRGERGAVAVLVALLLVSLLTLCALVVDIGRVVLERQHLRNALDAAALAGAQSLPNVADAQAQALAFAASNGAGITPTVTFWCVVGATSGGAVDTTQIPGACNPGAGPYTVNAYYGSTGRKVTCGGGICAIPCPASGTCNTISVSANKPVTYYVAPVIGINSGQTGTVTASACRGACGSAVPNPMNVVVVADRTSSMSSYISNLKTAIQSMMQTMTRSQQYVALDTIGKTSATPSANCPSDASSSATSGAWRAVKFSNDYTTGSTVPAPLNTSSNLYKAVNCLPTSSTGTWLASPFKDAARYLLGAPYDSQGGTDVAALGGSSRQGVVRNAIIFETDGAPNETNVSGSTTLSVAGDIGSSNAATACSNLTTVAQQAKTQGILVVTVAFGEALTSSCGSQTVPQVLASVASNDPRGGASLADYNCSTSAGRTAENSDGDYFFCADTSDPTMLSTIFQTALSQISGSSRLLQIPS